MDFEEELSLLIRARYPIIYISTAEEQRVEEEIHSVAKALQPPRQVWFWDFVNGYDVNNSARSNPLQALDAITQASSGQSYIFVLRDFHPFMREIPISRKLRNLARTLEGERKTVIIISPSLNIPEELSEDIIVQDFSLPNYKAIEEAFNQMIPKDRVRLDGGAKEVFIKACLGLSLTRVKQVLRKALASHGVIDEMDIELVLDVKKQLVRQKGALEFYPAAEDHG